MSEDAPRGGAGDAPDPDEALRRYADALAGTVDEAVPRWVDRVVRQVLAAQGLPVDADTTARLDQAATAARDAAVAPIRDLLATDVDQQRTNPLALLRALVRFPTEVLRAAGARPVARDEVDQRMFPDDVYGLTPASFADVDPALHEPGMAWGAAKAYVHLSRRRRSSG